MSKNNVEKCRRGSHCPLKLRTGYVPPYSRRTAIQRGPAYKNTHSNTLHVRIAVSDLCGERSAQRLQKLPMAPKHFLRVVRAKALMFSRTPLSNSLSFALRVMFAHLCFISGKHALWNASQSRGFGSSFFPRRLSRSMGYSEFSHLNNFLLK